MELLSNATRISRDEALALVAGKTEKLGGADPDIPEMARKLSSPTTRGCSGEPATTSSTKAYIDEFEGEVIVFKDGMGWPEILDQLIAAPVQSQEPAEDSLASQP